MGQEAVRTLTGGRDPSHRPSGCDSIWAQPLLASPVSRKIARLAGRRAGVFLLGRIVSSRSRKPHGAHTVISDVQVLAEQLYDLHTRFAILAEKLEEIFPAHESDFGVVQGLRCDFIRTTGERRTQPEHFARTCNAQRQAFAALGTHCQSCASFTQDVGSACRMSFPQQAGSARIHMQRFDGIECLQRLRG